MMRLYHAVIVGETEASADAADLLLVRDKFSWEAFLATPVWMIWHGMALLTLVYLVLSFSFLFAAEAMGMAQSGRVAALLGAKILIGFTACDFRLLDARRRGGRVLGVFVARNADDARRQAVHAQMRAGTS